VSLAAASHLSGVSEKMKTILIYAPDVVGHPRVYCRVIADALRYEDVSVVIALGYTELVGFAESPDLHPLPERANVTIVDTRCVSRSGEPHLTAEELCELQAQRGVDVTLFIEADKSNQQFLRIAKGDAPRLHGRNIGIFAKTSEWFPGEDSFTGEKIRLLAPTIRRTLGNVKRSLFDRRAKPRFFFENVILGSGVLNEIWVKDERLAAWRGAPVYWMPEISRPEERPESAEEKAAYDHRERELSEFLASNATREPVLYFGDAAFYKGYDLFLEFVVANPNVCAIHSGRTYDEQQQSYFRVNVEILREKIRGEGRLLETNSYVHTQRMKELYFGAVRLYITTHRLALSSSTMIQAIELGKPVLVPNRGLIGYRTRKNRLGGTYRYEDIEDLSRIASEMWQSKLSEYTPHIRGFWERFSDHAVGEFLVNRLVKS
jgi:hypothetical protein